LRNQDAHHHCILPSGGIEFLSRSSLKWSDESVGSCSGPNWLSVTPGFPFK
jgi:hypothetical protein